MRSVFITGTDTNVGKTLVSACLVHRWQADYWKPAQTGLATDPPDTETVAQLAGAGPARLHRPRYELQAPLSPEAAAELEGTEIRLEDFTLPQTRAPLIVEGAGGLLVPLGGGALMIDLITHLALPAILVARTTLGTINHTLLSIEALRARNIELLGIVLSGPPNPGNRAAIESYGSCPILAELPPLSNLDPATIARAAERFTAWPQEWGLGPFGPSGVQGQSPCPPEALTQPPHAEIATETPKPAA